LIIDKQKFRYTAVIDFVEITFRTKKASNGFSIKRNMDFDFVKPLDKRPGAAANEFRVKVQDIKRWSDLDKYYKKLKAEYELESEPKITCVEVSFDAYSIGATYDEMIEHVASYYWMLANPVSINRRFTRGQKGTTQGLASRSYMLNRLKGGGTIYIGDQRYDAEGMRIYYKTIDRKAQLPPEMHRSRIEITLRGNKCPFTTFEEARNFEFSNLARYFRFRQIKSNLSKLRTLVADRTPLLGERKAQQRKGRGAYMYSDMTMADTVLNEIVYDQLRYLTKRLNSGQKKKSR
jgi:hypothetical protein